MQDSKTGARIKVIVNAGEIDVTSFLLVPTAVAEGYPHLSWSAKATYAVLLSYGRKHAKTGGEVYPRIATLARATQLSTRQVKRILNELHKSRLILIEERPGRPSRYWLCRQPWMSPEVETVEVDLPFRSEDVMSPDQGQDVTGDNVTPVDDGGVNVSPQVGHHGTTPGTGCLAHIDYKIRGRASLSHLERAAPVASAPSLRAQDDQVMAPEASDKMLDSYVAPVPEQWTPPGNISSVTYVAPMLVPSAIPPEAVNDDEHVSPPSMGNVHGLDARMLTQFSNAGHRARIDRQVTEHLAKVQAEAKLIAQQAGK